jgi:hypothetical protein
MEAVVLIGLLGAGYLYNKDEDNSQKFVTKVDKSHKDFHSTPNGDNVYDSPFINEFSDEAISKDITMNLAKKNFTKDIDKKRHEDKLSDELKKNGGTLQEGFGAYDHLTLSSASGNYINPDDFLTNDQGIQPAPFFSGAGVNTNLDDTRALNSHQGGNEFYRSKSETGQFFKQTQDFGNVFGNKVDSDYILNKQRYENGNLRTNELPFTQEKVYHIDQKNNINGDIGRMINEKRNIDNLRTKTNPKISYSGKIISGKGFSKRELAQQVFKHDPETYYLNTPDKWLVTNGAYTAKSQRPQEILKETNRTCLNRQDIGSAGPAVKQNHELRSKFKKSDKKQFGTDTMRNLGTETSQNGLDLQKQGYRAIPNERDVTGLRTYDSNLTTENKLSTLGIQDGVKETIKQTTINSKNNGYVQNTFLQNTVGIQDNIKNTKKQTTIHSKNNGNIFGGYHKLTVGNESPEPTTKETTLFQHTGNAGGYINGNMNKNNYENAETNPTKEIIAQGREPTPSNTKLSNGSDTININIKKIESDYLTQHIRGVDKVYQEIPTDNTCKLTTMKDKLDDISIAERIDPNLLNPFRNNPFTQPLDSFAY